MGKSKLDISIIIPVLNEEESISELFNKIQNNLLSLRKTYEIIFIDDGSTDKSFEKMLQIKKKDKNVKIIQFRSTFGKSAALNTGFKEARGKIVFTMDADLQDDPKEIPKFLKKIDDDYDLVTGWKKKRFDSLSKTLPSKLFNFITSYFTGLRLHDFNCGFKAYRTDVIKSISIYGEMHRYIPALAHWKGFKVAEIPVKHHRRKFGKSKYGIERLLRGFFDFITVFFITRYNKKPMHFFGRIGLIIFLIGFCINLYMSILWFSGEGIGTRPLLILGILFIIIGIQFITTGLIAELIVQFQTNFEKEEYMIKRKL
jgi:glycosyltransferase involved in cell wall biosynthesis